MTGIIRQKFSWPALIYFVLIALSVSVFIPIPEKKLQFQNVRSISIFDRHGTLLREILSPKQGFGQWANLQNIAPEYLKAVVAVEDKQFFQHHGFSLTAILRAAWQNLRAGRIVSGGSTLTQQLIRQIYPIRPTLLDKIIEIWLALRLEHTLSKAEILNQYVNRVPFSNLNFGVEAAAQFYFGRPASHLSLGQAAFLAGLPQAPSRLNPLKAFSAAKKRQKQVLQAMLKLGIIQRTAFLEALQTPLDLTPAKRKFRAPHVVTLVAEKLQQQSPSHWPSSVMLTLDIKLQEAMEQVIHQELKGLQKAHVTNASAVVIDNQTGKILAWVGSADYFSEAIQGQVNGVLALRQPGSTLKAFTYLLALENGFTPASLLPDIPLHLSLSGGDFSPSNYDRQFHGPVRLRTALASSYNIPAVYLASQLGPENLLAKLRQAGFASLNKEASFYGPGLTLGNGEVSLLELTRAYSGLARLGVLPALRLGQQDFPILPSHYARTGVFADPAAAALVTHILSDNSARVPAFGEESPLALPFPCAAKTGTSKNYRDNWTIGYTTAFAVGVWVGNFDGAEMRQISGIVGAAPIFRDILLLLHRKKRPEEFSLPPEITSVEICPESGLLPKPICPARTREIFIKGTEPKEYCNLHQILINPATAKPALALIYPPEYQTWAKKEGIPQPLFFSKSTISPGLTLVSLTPTKSLKIVFPDDGAIFKFDPNLPTRFQKILLQAKTNQKIKQITWLVDGKPIGAASPPFSLFWQMIPGIHTIQARSSTDQSIISQPVKIRILGRSNYLW